MSQRNFMNDRYNDENKKGSTRKSSASAKPKAQRAATVRDPAPKSKKQKKQEARERERAAAQKADALSGRYETTEGYKRLRRIWWVLLVGAILCTALSFVFSRDENLSQFAMVVMVLAYVLIIAAFYIDLGKIRKERKIYNASIANSKSKEARREQKRIKAEMREQEKEAAEKAEATENEKSEGGFFSRFRKKSSESEPEKPEPEESEAEAEQEEEASAK